MCILTARDLNSSMALRPLFLALELSDKTWKLGFALGLGQKPREITIPSGETERLLRQIARAREHFNLSVDAPVRSCYEAGRDGFWLHRFLLHEGIENVVIDPSSVAVDRRARRVKTDRLDLNKLLRHLIRSQDDPHEWREVRPPEADQEDVRQIHRELEALKKERNQHICRIKGLLVAQGLKVPVDKHFLKRLNTLQLWDGSPLPPFLRYRLEREHERLQLVKEQTRNLEKVRRELIKSDEGANGEMARRLLQLRGIGEVGSWLLATEIFSWREIKNRRELASLAGLTPTPFQSGNENRQQGISKAGNRWVRGILIELAWGWTRFQPNCQLTRWFKARFGTGGKRARKIGIVALARKLLIALWRFIEQGTVPEGAVLKAA